MREILFRGKRIDTGEWVYGDLVHIGNKSYISYYYESALSTFINETIEYDGISIVGVAPFIEVDPTTVGQYTGLTDKNDKKIFDGDIVKATGLYPDRDGEKLIWRQSRVGEIFYYHSAFYFYKWLLCKTSQKCLEIIGNIHDNPELLEDKQ